LRHGWQHAFTSDRLTSIDGAARSHCYGDHAAVGKYQPCTLRILVLLVAAHTQKAELSTTNDWLPCYFDYSCCTDHTSLHVWRVPFECHHCRVRKDSHREYYRSDGNMSRPTLRPCSVRTLFFGEVHRRDAGLSPMLGLGIDSREVGRSYTFLAIEPRFGCAVRHRLEQGSGPRRNTILRKRRPQSEFVGVHNQQNDEDGLCFIN
jgi:hypothetical protein